MNKIKYLLAAMLLVACSVKGPTGNPVPTVTVTVTPSPTYHTVTSCVEYQDSKRQVCENGALSGAAIGWLIGMPLTSAIVGSGKSECHEEVVHNCVKSETKQVKD